MAFRLVERCKDDGEATPFYFFILFPKLFSASKSISHASSSFFFFRLWQPDLGMYESSRAFEIVDFVTATDRVPFVCARVYVVTHTRLLLTPIEPQSRFGDKLLEI